MHNFFIVDLFPQWRPPRISPRLERVNTVLAKLGFWARFAPPVVPAMTNVEQRMNLFHLLDQVLAYDVPGDVVELGCHSGMSSALIRTILNGHGNPRAFHVYDSFEGLPAKHPADVTESYSEGQMATSKESLIERFEKCGLELPMIHEGWFEDTLPGELPDEIAFAYLDGDFYDSIMVSLEHVYPRLAPGAICLIDDYCDPAVFPDRWNELPGVKAACDDYLTGKPEEVTYLYSGGYSHGFFRKQRVPAASGT